jgi:hypothetical protein
MGLRHLTAPSTRSATTTSTGNRTRAARSKPCASDHGRLCVHRPALLRPADERRDRERHQRLRDLERHGLPGRSALDMFVIGK